MDLKELITEAYSNSVNHGFHDGEENQPPELIAGMKLALIHSEVSEALECVRSIDSMDTSYMLGKPEGYLSELADVVIRVGDEVGRLDKVEEFIMVLRQKMAYNRSRPYKHGRKC